MNIYIACALTHVPRDIFGAYAEFIELLADRLNSASGASVKYALRDSDPQLAARPAGMRARLCYLWDREMVEWADVLVADASYPSIGLGIELQVAENMDKPILLCFRKDESTRAESVSYELREGARHSLQIGEGFVTLMALGLPSIFRVIPYSSSDEAIAAILDAVRDLELSGRDSAKR